MLMSIDHASIKFSTGVFHVEQREGSPINRQIMCGSASIMVWNDSSGIKMT